MIVSFKLPPPRTQDSFRALLERVASALSERAVKLECRERHEAHDENGQRACFTGTWADGDVTLTHRVVSGSGNPRDGYGYDIDLTLTTPRATFKLRTGDWEPVPSTLRLELDESGQRWLQLREVLRRELGVANDECLDANIVAPVLDALMTEKHLEPALALAKECLAAASPAAYGRHRVVAWLAANDPATGGVQFQVKEAPAVLVGWLSLERAGDQTLAPTFARLCPFDLPRWEAARLAPAPWFAHPQWPFLAAPFAEGSWKRLHLRAGLRVGLVEAVSRFVTGWSAGVEWEDVSGEPLPEGQHGWRWSLARRARWSGASSSPHVHVTLLGVRRESDAWKRPPVELYALPMAETLRWTWIPGPEVGDVLLFVERALPLRGEHPTAAAISFTTSGSSAFRERAEAAVTRVTRLRWHEVSAEQSFEPCDATEETEVIDPIPTKRMRALEKLLGTLRRCANIGLNYDMWEQHGAQHSSPEEQAQMRAEFSAATSAGDAAKASLLALVAQTRAEAPQELAAWADAHDAYLGAFLAKPSPDETGAFVAQKERALWAEVRAGTRAYVEENVFYVTMDAPKYRELFGIDPETLEWCD